MLLAIDTATRMLSLALHDGERVLAESSWETANHHTVELAPAIHDLCASRGTSVQALTALAVAQGPGSFSGLRVGIGLAKGLALALTIPLFAVPTLDIVAAAQPPAKGALIAVAQAGRARVCAGRYTWRRSTGWSAASPVEIVGWEALIDSLAGETLIAGEIDSAARSLIAASARPIHLAPPALNLRRASVLADLAWARLRAGETPDPAALLPIYVNQPGVPHP